MIMFDVNLQGCILGFYLFTLDGLQSKSFSNSSKGFFALQAHPILKCNENQVGLLFFLGGRVLRVRRCVLNLNFKLYGVETQQLSV